MRSHELRLILWLTLAALLGLNLHGIGQKLMPYATRPRPRCQGHRCDCQDHRSFIWVQCFDAQRLFAAPLICSFVRPIKKDLNKWRHAFQWQRHFSSQCTCRNDWREKVWPTHDLAEKHRTYSMTLIGHLNIHYVGSNIDVLPFNQQWVQWIEFLT